MGMRFLAILRIYIFGRKSRSANNFRKWSDFGLWRQKYQPRYGPAYAGHMFQAAFATPYRAS